ncbi:hypothetical protein [Pedobacter sp. UC225_65]|uniref:hypothetical protein n=1 Tax=Pedobacter sp. UC225_65 TaxID=3350173 RepID=UPI0036710F19
MPTVKYETQHRCGHCDKELFGRSDKKYCNDTCRNKANSFRRKRIKWDEPKHVYQISRDLLRNRRIMADTHAWEGDPKFLTRGQMLDKGFNFDFYTNILETKKGRYYYCYEYGYKELENGKIMIVMTEKYFEMTIRVKDYDRE